MGICEGGKLCGMHSAMRGSFMLDVHARREGGVGDVEEVWYNWWRMDEECATMSLARIIKSGEVVTGLAGQGCLCEVLELSSCDSHIICKVRRVSS